MQILLTLAATTISCVTFWLSLWPVAFSAGAIVVTCNLLWLAMAVQWCTEQKYTKKLALIHFLLFIFRFSLLALVLYVLIAWLHMPVLPLVAGLSSVIISLVLWGLSLVSGHSFKEV